MLTKIKIERQKRCLKAKELAERVGVDPSYITLIENGREPSSEIKKKISKVLGQPMRALWANKDI